MSPLLLPWLLVTATLGQSDLGPLGMVIGLVAFAGLAIALAAIVRRPSWQLLWFLLPIAVPHIFLQVVGVWLIGDHHETATLSLFAAVMIAALAGAGYAARANPVAVVGVVVFAVGYALIAYEASLFVFWNGLH